MPRLIKFSFSEFRLLVTLVSAGLLITATLLAPPSLPSAWLVLIIVPFIIFQVYFPLRLLQNDIRLIHVIVLGSGLWYGTAATGWAAVLGISLGYLLRRKWPETYARHTSAVQTRQRETGFAIGLNIIPLVLALSAFGLTNGIAASHGGIPDIWRVMPGPSLLFFLVHGELFLVDFWFRQEKMKSPFWQDLVWLGLIEFLPLPFVTLTLITFPLIQAGSLIILGTIPTILTVLLNWVILARSRLERRVQELSILNRISDTLRSTLDLDNLLTVIHLQVTQLLRVDNFYVALYDLEARQIWYPLAVKHDRRQHWAPRPLTDRLTDRVILERKPILIRARGREELVRSGLPLSEDTPYAWMGVPLVTSDRAIGCLAVFSISAEVEFTQADLDLLIILSGQASVAFENALLYEQAQRRAAQLETLNKISRLITASLDPKEVLAQVCSSVTQVGGGQRSAIFLLDTDTDQIWLAHSQGLSDTFIATNQAYSLSQNARTRSLRAGQPVLTPDVSNYQLDEGYVESLKNEGIQAVADFPLVTPDGQIGYLSVFFNTPHTFLLDELELLQTFASQAALAVSNARLHASTDQALALRVRQLSILEAVGRELAAAIQSERLFDLILDYALEFTNSRWGNIRLYNPQTGVLEVKAARGYIQNPPNLPAQEGITGRTLRMRQAIISSDVRNDPDHLDFTGGATRSQISIPLLHEERVLGVLTTETDREEAFSEHDQAFLSQLATQAAIAVVNAELYAETQRRLSEQSLLYQTSTHLVGVLELQSVLYALLHNISAAILTQDTGIYLWDEVEQNYYLEASKNAQATSQLKNVIAAHQLSDFEGKLLAPDPLFIPPKDINLDHFFADYLDCQAIIFPLVIARQRLGMVVIQIDPGLSPGKNQVQLLSTLISQGAISLQNALLFSDVTTGRDRLAAVLNTVHEGIVLIEGNGRITIANEAMESVTGLPREEFIGKPLTDLPEHILQILGYAHSREAEILVTNLDQGRVPSPPKVVYNVGDHNPERVLERTTAPVSGQAGRAIGWVMVFRDVTEEYQINQARDLITETLVHDLRSPIGSVLVALDLIDDTLPGEVKDDLSLEAIAVARKGANRVLGMVESLLEIARMQSGNMDLTVSPLKIRALVAQTLAEIGAQSSEFGIELVNNAPDNLPTVYADQGKITRVINNLVDNALKFTPTGGEVVISAGLAPNNLIVVQVSDCGPGIPEEYREKIFQRFGQIPGIRGRRRGSGLGLTFCRLAVEAHGGRIWVEPRPGGGSIFTFTLPLTGPHPDISPQQSPKY